MDSTLKTRVYISPSRMNFFVCLKTAVFSTFKTKMQMPYCGSENQNVERCSRPDLYLITRFHPQILEKGDPSRVLQKVKIRTHSNYGIQIRILWWVAMVFDFEETLKQITAANN